MRAAKAASFLARAESPARVGRALGEAVASVGRPSGALVFVSGDLASRLEEVGRFAETALGGLPALVVAGHGVLSERGELEGQTGASGIVFSGGEVETLGITGSESQDLGAALASALESLSSPTATAFVFVRPRGFLPHMVEPLERLKFSRLLGGGTAGDGQVLSLASGQAPRLADAGALVLRGVTPPCVRTSAACRLLTQLGRITECRGSMVLEIEGQRALEVLSVAASNLSDQPLLFVALSIPSLSEDEEPEILLRGIQGVDPVRQGILVSEEVRLGMRMAFAVRDGGRARADLESMTARLSRETAGAQPTFGVYVSCAGRGASLYGAPDVDVRVIKHRFPELPFAGLHSSFEIAPHGGSPALQLYSGVFALFTRPS